MCSHLDGGSSGAGLWADPQSALDRAQSSLFFLLPRPSSLLTARMKASKRDWVTLPGLGGGAVPWPRSPQETGLPTLGTWGFPFAQEGSRLFPVNGAGLCCSRPWIPGSQPGSLSVGFWAGQPSLTSVSPGVKWECVGHSRPSEALLCIVRVCRAGGRSWAVGPD